MSINSFIKRIIAIIVTYPKGIKPNGSEFSLCVKIVGKGKLYLSRVKVRSFVKIYISEQANIAIGENSDIGDNSVISACNNIQIGNHVLIGPHIYIADHNHKYTDIHSPIMYQGTTSNAKCSISIGDDTWICTNSVIVGNINIGKHCVIGANSVVTKDIPDYSVAAGVPAKIIKRYNLSSQKWENIK